MKDESKLDIDKVNLRTSLSVREVLKIPIFKGSKVIAGKMKLQNECKHITILETPEGIEWLEGGEFLLSTGYAFKDDKGALENVIYRASKQNVSAIAIKEKRYINYIPQRMIDQANEYGVPLIMLPYNFIYTKALTSFYNALMYKKNSYIYESQKMHDKLLRLILENKNVPDTVNALSKLTNFSIIIMDTISNVICKNIISGHKNVCKKIFEGNKLFHNIELFLNEPYVNEYGDYKIYMYKLSCKDDIIGYMYVISELLYKSLYTDVIENGKRILELKLEKEKNEPLNAVNLNKVITNIILNSKSLPDKFYLNIRNNYKWNNKKSFIGICIDIYTKSQKLIEQICSLIGRIFNGQGFFITEDANKIFIFFPMDGDVNLKDIVDKVCIFLNKYDKSVSASFSASKIYDNIKDIPKMYNECYITSLFNKEKETLYYDSLDTIKLLYTLKENMQTSEYCNKTLGSIKKYDSENKSELVKTLNTYFKFNMNKKVVSKELHIHPETLRYRLSKIEDLTGYSLHNSEGIFALQMGIKLYKMINYNNSSF